IDAGADLAVDGDHRQRLHQRGDGVGSGVDGFLGDAGSDFSHQSRVAHGQAGVHGVADGKIHGGCPVADCPGRSPRFSDYRKVCGIAAEFSGVGVGVGVRAVAGIP
ncbi:hypothetical protein OY671_011203, partial [Metschnikowia pulcherrima]